MSQENVELHGRAIDAFHRRDLGAYLALNVPRGGVRRRTRFGSRGASPTGAMPAYEAGGRSPSRSARISGQRSTRYVTSATGRSAAGAFAGRAREAARPPPPMCWPTESRDGKTVWWCVSATRPRPSKPPATRSRLAPSSTGRSRSPRLLGSHSRAIEPAAHRLWALLGADGTQVLALGGASAERSGSVPPRPGRFAN